MCVLIYRCSAKCAPKSPRPKPHPPQNPLLKRAFSPEVPPWVNPEPVLAPPPRAEARPARAKKITPGVPVHGEFANPRINGSARAVRPRRRRAAPDRDRSRRCQSQRNYEFATHRRIGGTVIDLFTQTLRPPYLGGGARCGQGVQRHGAEVPMAATQSCFHDEVEAELIKRLAAKPIIGHCHIGKVVRAKLLNH